VEAALEKIATYPGETLMMGDTPYDIQAALKLGVQTVAFRCGGWTDDELTGAIAIYDHPEDLLTHLDFSPLAASLLTRQQAEGGAA
jgi:phosphoglycolate phosphatase-like HAD superfamily hydrolase